MNSIVNKLRDAIQMHQNRFNGERPFAFRLTHDEYYELIIELERYLPDPIRGIDIFSGVPLQVGSPCDIGAYVER
jgi:hypothetical protein